MNITLKRNKQHLDALLGDLYIDGKCICNSLENSQTALQKGNYRIVRHPCKLTGRIVLLVVKDNESHTANKKCRHCKPLAELNNNSPSPCFCPQIKAGNGIHKRHDGRIVVGELIADYCTIHTQNHFDKLHERIRKQLSRKNSVTLVIE